ncbi:hypothetical protein DNTS_026622 [Danionella cerebrum]|uniref:Uncharacterized protein n=1 Tax=Danionella cerebrum TaxID=2873325 RepID=A0A553QDL5_9TELE|nr:hypothetical protein DNTS_026622 [Danionella translucida]
MCRAATGLSSAAGVSVDNLDQREVSSCSGLDVWLTLFASACSRVPSAADRQMALVTHSSSKQKELEVAQVLCVVSS